MSHDLQKRLAVHTGRYQHAKQTYRDERRALKEAKQVVLDTEKAADILITVAKEIQESAHKRIAEIVSRCINVVFPEDKIEFTIDFVRKRGKTEAEFVFTQDGNRLDLREGVFGGVLDIAAFGLNLAAIMLSVPQVRKLLVQDEPFKSVSRGKNRARVRRLLEAITEDLGVQIVMTTHDKALQVGKIIHLE